ncbi:glyoxalase [Tenacibaculum sp. 190524A05c]|uniref:VOC family protein n=1 Tax=Tenacibaculum platacis TaxID=3137852 RepID=UPI0031FAAD4D
MKFKKLKLYTNQLEAEFEFYSKTLGFEVLERNTNYFSVKIGWSELSFEKTQREYKYHYCFLIPSNKLNEALKWMEKRTEIVNIENGKKTQNFDSWNAESFYFYDASGNIAEFIVRYDLNNDVSDEFDISKVLGVNEMGMPTSNVKKINDQLRTELQTEYWKGDIERFGTNGSQEGIFLLPNYNLKDIWFPTSIKIKPEPFEAVIENKEREYHIEYRNEKIKTTANIDNN